MDPDEQKKQIKKSEYSQRYEFNAGHVLPSVGVRSFIQDALKRYWELLGYRYHILLLVRSILAAVLATFQIFQ
jgi:hypothetical protein